jgi:ribosomal protein S18 acetylase RimI-like enzyme
MNINAEQYMAEFNSYLSDKNYKFDIQNNNTSIKIYLNDNNDNHRALLISFYELLEDNDIGENIFELSITNLFVDHDLRGKGIATFLLFMIFEIIFRTKGYIDNIKVTLDDMSDHTREEINKNIYQKIGLHYVEMTGRDPSMIANLNVVHRKAEEAFKKIIKNNNGFFMSPQRGGSKNTHSKLKIKEKKLKEKIKEKKLKEKIKEKKLKEKIKEKTRNKTKVNKLKI